MTLRPADIRDTVLVSLSAVVAALVTAVLPVVGLPLAALALGWIAYRFGTGPSAFVALCVAAVTAAFLTYDAVFVVIALLAAGPGTVWALRRWPAMRVIAVVAGVLAAAGVTPLAISWIVSGHSPLGEIVTAVDQASRASLALQLRQPGADATALRTSEALVRHWVLVLMPSFYLCSMGLAAAFAVPLVSWLGRRMGEVVNSLPPIEELDLSFHLVWPAIAGLAALAGAAYLGKNGTALEAVGANLLLVVRPALFFQGLADFAALYRKAKVGKLGRAFGFTFLAFTEVTLGPVPSISLLGLVDLFANLRRLPRAGAGTPVATT